MGHTEGEIAQKKFLLLLQYYKNFTRFVAQYDWSCKHSFSITRSQCVTFILYEYVIVSVLAESRSNDRR